MLIYPEHIKKYEKHFKHLRILGGIERLRGDLLVEAELPDGRYVTQIIRDEPGRIEKLLKDWSPNANS